ncbi:MAG: MgtC/SapB family protein [Actinomycetota bacterium]|nr:MgtC/SapB family protein [Actinomycetota bacterium]
MINNMGLAESLIKDFSLSFTPFLVNFLIPCLLALIFGGIIGFQRERADRPAGLRTHSLVCLGSTVFTLISYYGFLSFTGVDQTRIASGIITGIGFIGAGAIFRRGPLVKGVTTAASIWIVASVGMALGIKLYYLALAVTVFGYIVLTLVKYFEDRFVTSPVYAVKITAGLTLPGTEEIQKIIKSSSERVEVRLLKIESGSENYEIIINAQSRDPNFPVKTADSLNGIKHIENIEITQY